MQSTGELTMDELRAVVFSTYTEPELMRHGVHSGGGRSGQLRRAHIAGEPIDEIGRRRLVGFGIGFLVRKLKHQGSRWIVFDKEKGVVRRVRA
jgi:hypothetical protein